MYIDYMGAVPQYRSTAVTCLVDESSEEPGRPRRVKQGWRRYSVLVVQLLGKTGAPLRESRYVDSLQSLRVRSQPV